MRRVLALSLLLCVLFLDADVAPAQVVTPPPASILSSLDPDGEPCTGVPDPIPGVFDFTAACTLHDACCVAAGHRLDCDMAFRQAMIAACVAQRPDVYDARALRLPCFAELHYAGVRLFGGFFHPRP